MEPHPLPADTGGYREDPSRPLCCSGLWHVAAVHARVLSALPEADLVACCDIIPERAAALADSLGVPKRTADYHDILADPEIDSVTICTPHYLHAPMIVAAAAAGKHVLVEKPLAMDSASAAGAVAACRRAGVRLAVCLQNRMNTATVQVKRAIEEGLLGDLLMLSGQVLWYRGEEYYTESPWRGRWATEGGGALINQAIHTLDLMIYLGRGVRAVSARMGTLGHRTIEVEDAVSAVLEYESGALGTFAAATCAYPGSDVRLEVLGSEGAPSSWGRNSRAFRPGRARCPAARGGERPARRGGQGLLRVQPRPGGRRLYRRHPRGRDPEITGEDGQASIDLLDAIYTSARTHADAPVERAPAVEPASRGPDARAVRSSERTGEAAPSLGHRDASTDA